MNMGFTEGIIFWCAAAICVITGFLWIRDVWYARKAGTIPLPPHNIQRPQNVFIDCDISDNGKGIITDGTTDMIFQRTSIKRNDVGWRI